MRTIVLDEGFGIDNLRQSERPEPEPGPGEVRVRLSAVSLNYRDVLLVEGHYNPRQTFPVIPCSDGAGTVDAVGLGVTQFKPGDRVANVFMAGWESGPAVPEVFGESRGGPGGDGLLCDAAVFRETDLLPIPDSMSFPQAASLPCAAVTAWSAIFSGPPLTPASRVVVQGTGGVALFAAQFAKSAGARVAVISSSSEKLKSISDLQPDHTINYRDHPDWGKKLRAEFATDGVDLIIELGGAKTIEQSLRAIRAGGTIALIGVLSGPIAPVNLPLVVMRQVRLQGITVGSRQSMREMLSAMAAHDIKPVIDQCFPFEKAADAFAHMKSGGHVGKIVIEVS